MTDTNINISNLSAVHIDAMVRNVDWRETLGEWWAYEVQECEDCGEDVLLSNFYINETHQEIDPDTECEGGCFTFEGPMMNYFYPCVNTGKLGMTSGGRVRAPPRTLDGTRKPP